MLKDVSTNGTAVAYNSQAGNEKRNHFTWILDLEKEVGRWELKVHVKKLALIVELATHKTCIEEYNHHVEKFVKTAPTLDVLAKCTPTELASPALKPFLPIYVGERELGCGSFGSVDKVINVNTREIFARKNFFEPQWARSEKRRAEQREKWLAQVNREIRIMKENKHVSMISLAGRMRSHCFKGKHRRSRE